MDLPIDVPRERFEELVDLALAGIPGELLAMTDNVAVVVVDEPPADDADLLGLYDGRPLTERDGYGFEPPDVITIFRMPILRLCSDVDEVVEEVKVTVVHEIAHHFGIDDDRLHELGWD